MTRPEPWLRGPLPGINPMVANLFYSFAQAREELPAAIEDLSTGEIWNRPLGLASVGFHIRHMGGAAERLGSYLRGGPLTEAQLSELRLEGEPRGATGAELLADLAARQKELEQFVGVMDTATLGEARLVGRARLPSTVIGLIVHIAEHTQRHLGQAITTAKLVRALRPAGSSTGPPTPGTEP